MKKLLFMLLTIALLSIGLNACNKTATIAPNPEVEGDINTTATSDDFADLGNKIWIDVNKDGIKQKPESGFAGITVNLYKDANKDGQADGPVFMTDTTDKGGYYRFNKLNPDINYLIEVIAPSGYKFSKKNNNNAKNKDYDSDINPSTGLTDSIDVLKGRYFYWFDAALYSTKPSNLKLARVGDKIWLDTNKDGIKQRSEAGLANITLNLWVEETIYYNKPNKKISSTQTNSEGNYEFKDLDPNLGYYVQIELPANYKVSQKHNPNAKGKDWDNDFDVNAFTDKLKLTEGKFNYWLADGAIYKGVSDPSVCSDPVNVPDATLKSLLEQMLHGTITCAGLEGLTEIDLYDNNSDTSLHIKDLTGLQYAKNVELLVIPSNNKISDLSPIGNLPKLKQLAMSQTLVSDISPLVGLAKLENLIITNSLITDISPISNLKNLEFISFGFNQIKDISVLENLSNPQIIYLYGNQITDISPLVKNNHISGKEVNVSIEHNCLDLSSNPDLKNINILKDRGVNLDYKPQSNCN